MKKNWQVKINQDGTLFIHGKKKDSNVIDLFGQNQVEYGLCIYAHYLRPLRKLLNRLFPKATIKNLEAIEEIIRDEFLRHQSVSALKSLLDEEEIPYRSYSNVA
ncbi:MAG: hypothetical protein HKN67_10910 [Saprospiraceae bacterium]|nr:hypothetical protein [Bacteroidia bacterium]MBT8230440.1 hypothetical protein [Bacteroidia bacterium]NNF22445.1 hypothetical protein [Saprospiraceae bacterium]NNK90301.1 hypothetical protein [Saprospiraceae bacterium]